MFISKLHSDQHIEVELKMDELDLTAWDTLCNALSEKFDSVINAKMKFGKSGCMQSSA